MKVQLQGQSLRLRIDERELTALLAGESVSNVTRLAPALDWLQEIALHEGQDLRVTHAADALRIALPRQRVAALQAALPSRDGLAFEVGEGACRLEIRFDVDVRDSVRERGVGRYAHAAAPSRA